MIDLFTTSFLLIIQNKNNKFIGVLVGDPPNTKSMSLKDYVKSNEHTDKQNILYSMTLTHRAFALIYLFIKLK